MKYVLPRLFAFALIVTLVSACGTSRTAGTSSDRAAPLEYVVNLNDRTDDTFKVTLRVDDLEPDNAVYHFASTAPGTYQIMDIGRYVRSFEALDASGTIIPSERISTNQWQITAPEDVVEIRYEIAETWDTPVDEHPIYRMAGTSIEDDHVQINGQAVFGYPEGMQARPLQVRLDRPADWIVGTALEVDATGSYLAADYDYVVDSPILAGRLSSASVDVRGTDVDIYTYSVNDSVHAEEIMEATRAILDAAGTYLGAMPVDRYAFLFHFEDQTVGALEHSYSSTYTLAEADFDRHIQGLIPDIVAHEFLHIVTPLNIHSEIIEQFNFVEPTPSEHVWLYEGVTEWMSHASQLRGGLIDLEAYLGRLSAQLQANDRFDPAFSLSDIGLRSYTEKGQREWGNIYQRGALVASLLDLQLLALSGGERGLREVILELSETYGPNRAFDEATFFDEFADRTYPEIRTFFERYVRGTDPLPLQELLALVGVTYVPELHTGEQVASFGDIYWQPAGERLAILSAAGPPADCGLTTGDVVLSLNGEDVTIASARESLAPMRTSEVGEPFTFIVQRGEDEHTLTCAREWTERIEHHRLSIDPKATPEQVALREAWARRL